MLFWKRTHPAAATKTHIGFDIEIAHLAKTAYFNMQGFHTLLATPEEIENTLEASGQTRFPV